jgi:hypothetical protein
VTGARAVVALMIALVTPARGEGPERALGLVPPVTVAAFDLCADGGSLKGILLDSTSVEYHVFIKVVLFGGGPRPWYVGADWDSGQAEKLPEVDSRKDAIKAILVQWLDRTYTAVEQAQILADPRSDPRPAYVEPPLFRMIKISEPDSAVLADTTLTLSERRCEFNSHFAGEWPRYSQRDVDKAYRIMRFLGRGRVSNE